MGNEQTSDKDYEALAAALLALRRHLSATNMHIATHQLADLEKAEHALRSFTPSARLEKDEFPLLCEVVDGAIQFVIGANVLAHATNICPTLYDAERDHGRYRVTDPTVFAKAVADELNHEDEAGNTPLTRMLDEAIDDAINQGAEGVEENNDPRQRYVHESKT